MKTLKKHKLLNPKIKQKLLKAQYARRKEMHKIARGFIKGKKIIGW